MTITHTSADTISVKTKNEVVTFGNGVTIGSYKITTAGEYDVAAIQCEAQFLKDATSYIVRSEELTITYLSQTDTTITEQDDAPNTDILMVDVRSDDKIDDLKIIVKELEPSYVLLIGAGATAEFRSQLGIPNYDATTLKVTRAGLPLEGTSLIPLS